MKKIRLLFNLSNDKCERGVYVSDGKNPIFKEFTPKLDRGVSITVGESERTLGKIADTLINHGEQDIELLFQERGQYSIGTYLFDQLFDNLQDFDISLNGDEPVEMDIHIITEDENILRLPWALINRKGNFIAATGSSVNFSLPHSVWKAADVTPSPRVLAVIPEPIEKDETGAQEHIQELAKIFSHHAYKKEIAIAKNWDEFKEKIKIIKPDFIYYYGHCDSSDGISELIFEQSDSKMSEPVSANVFANFLRDLGNNRPSMIYANCCAGDAGGILGIGSRLREIVPAVITTCSKITDATAKNQAHQIWKNILIEKLPPHKAVANVRKDYGKIPDQFSKISWLLPVIHCSYSTWNFNPYSEKDEAQINWRNKLDRDNPVAVAKHYTEEMLSDGSQRVLTFLWFGKKGQGVEYFYDRFISELKAARWLNYRNYPPVKPRWLPHFNEFYSSLKEMMEEAFDAKFENIAEKLRVAARREGGDGLLVFVINEVVSEGMALYDAETLSKYLRWLNDEFASLFEDRVHLIIGLPYIIEDSAELKAGFDECQRKEFQDMVFYVLGELTSLSSIDLNRFLTKNKKKLTPDEKSDILNYIISKTGGNYEEVIVELESLLNNHLEYIERVNQFPNRDIFK